MPKSRNPITVAQAAEIVGVDRKTVLRWIDAGRLPATKLPAKTGAYLLDPSDVERLAKAAS